MSAQECPCCHVVGGHGTVYVRAAGRRVRCPNDAIERGAFVRVAGGPPSPPPPRPPVLAARESAGCLLALVYLATAALLFGLGVYIGVAL